MSETTITKPRDIAFRGPHAPERGPTEGVAMLREADGIVSVGELDKKRVPITYDLAKVTFSEIELALQEVGFHLDNGVIHKLRRALYQYADETQRAYLGLTEGICTQSCAQKVFVEHYRRQDRGCRDERPAYLRRYL